MKNLTSKNDSWTGRKTRGQRGFTLLELAIVICILAILVGVAVAVMVVNRKKADHSVAVHNLMVSARTIDNLWYSRLAAQEGCPLEQGAYRDYTPPAEMSGESTGGYVAVDAKYMSLRERKMTWVDMTVEGGSEPIASLGAGPYAEAPPAGFCINGVWKNGELIASGTEIQSDWNVLPGKIVVIENLYWWDGGWQDNSDNQYLTLMTYEKVGIAHFYTLFVGNAVAGGTFSWNDGNGTPGDSFGDELASAPDNPPANPPPPDTGPEPPGPPPATQPEPPATQPEPPATAPEPPPAPPEGDNQAEEIDVTPESLNPEANGVWDVYITLRSGYDPYNVDPSSIRAYGAAPVDVNVTGNGLHLKFRREDLANVPQGNNVLFVVTGLYYDGTPFQAWDYITIH